MSYIQELRQAVGSRPLIMVGAGVLILDVKGHILLLRRTDNNAWGIPGGAMELEESLEQTARREAHEETGLIVGELVLYHLFSGPQMYYRYPNGDEVYNVSVVYLVKNVKGELHHNSQEHSEARYFSPRALPQDINPPDIPIIERFKETHATPKRYGLPGFGGNI
jgi:8-oxo-dGTP pyrophosphatase MutT (NUDIX family)